MEHLETIRGKKIFYGPEGLMQIDVHNPVKDWDGKLKSAGPMTIERDRNRKAIAVVDEEGRHEVRRDSNKQIVGLGNQNVRPGSLDEFLD